MVFQYTLVNGEGYRHTLITDKFFEPGQRIVHFGEEYLVEDLTVGSFVSCAELHTEHELVGGMICGNM